MPATYTRGILDLTSQPASVNPSVPSANRPRLSYAERLKGSTTTSSDANRPFYPVPDSVVPEITMEVREEYWDESLWLNSLKLHLTGRNAAGISRDAVRAALLAVGVNPKDIVDLWRGEISHQINLSFKTEGGVMACLTADTIDLPNGVKGNFLHANRTLADIKVHWVPACFSDRAFSELFDKVCTVREVRTLYDENGIHTGVRTLRVEMARGTLPQIPHLIHTKEGHRFLVTVKGRQPKCLGCGALGHTRSDCPQSWAGQQRRRQGQQQQKQQQQAPKMTSLGHVPVTRTSAATKTPATTPRGQDAAGTAATDARPVQPAQPAHPPQQTEPAQPAKPTKPAKPAQPTKTDQTTRPLLPVELPQGGDSTQAAGSPPDGPMTDSEVTAASDDFIPCGQTRFRSTHEMESSASLEAIHQGLPTPRPARQVGPTMKRGPDDTEEDTGLKRKCVDEAEELMDSQSDFEPGGNKFFTPGESGDSQC